MNIDIKIILWFVGVIASVNIGIILLLWKRLYKVTDDKLIKINEKINDVREQSMEGVKAEKEERKFYTLNSDRISSEIFGKITTLTANIQELIKEIGDMKGMIGEVKGRVNGLKQEKVL